MYAHTGNNCSQPNSKKDSNRNLEAVPGKTLDRFTTKDSYTWNITHNTESTAV